jgi:hypothetical protein
MLAAAVAEQFLLVHPVAVVQVAEEREQTQRAVQLRELLIPVEAAEVEPVLQTLQALLAVQAMSLS